MVGTSHFTNGPSSNLTTVGVVTVPSSASAASNSSSSKWKRTYEGEENKEAELLIEITTKKEPKAEGTTRNYRCTYAEKVPNSTEGTYVIAISNFLAVIAEPLDGEKMSEES